MCNLQRDKASTATATKACEMTKKSVHYHKFEKNKQTFI